MNATDLLKKHPIISDQVDAAELTVILRELEKVVGKNVVGDVAEFGCYNGTTSLFLQRLLQLKAPHKKLHVYDSFEGLPEKTHQDMSTAGEQFKAGELRTSKNQLIENFKKAGLPLPVIHKDWFADLTPKDVPDQICFAFLDGDFYQSITDSLRLVWPALSKEATVIIDDYQAEALPGAQRAITEWLKVHPATVRTEASLAVVYPYPRL